MKGWRSARRGGLMGRKNRRAETFEPLDFTPDDVAPAWPPLPSTAGPREYHRREVEKRDERRKRQQAARVNKGIDWSVCLVPGCGKELLGYFGRTKHEDPRWRDAEVRLPMCLKHLSVAHSQFSMSGTPRGLLLEATVLVLERAEAKRQELQDAEKAARLASIDGDMYFIRLNEMVKVGWTRNLRSRLRAYGASAELLVHYPATRHDETNLHRQLRPALAKGREWYEDGPIIQRFIADAIAKHGPPTVQATWSTPTKIVGGKRTARR